MTIMKTYGDSQLMVMLADYQIEIGHLLVELGATAGEQNIRGDNTLEQYFILDHILYSLSYSFRDNHFIMTLYMFSETTSVDLIESPLPYFYQKFTCDKLIEGRKEVVAFIHANRLLIKERIEKSISRFSLRLLTDLIPELKVVRSFYLKTWQVVCCYRQLHFIISFQPLEPYGSNKSITNNNRTISSLFILYFDTKEQERQENFEVHVSEEFLSAEDLSRALVTFLLENYDKLIHQQAQLTGRKNVLEQWLEKKPNSPLSVKADTREPGQLLLVSKIPFNDHDNSEEIISLLEQMEQLVIKLQK